MTWKNSSERRKTMAREGKKIGKGSAAYEELFHYAASDEWHWKGELHTGNKRCVLKDRTAYCDNRAIAVFDVEHNRVFINHEWDDMRCSILWSIRYGIRRAFSHWESDLNVDALTIRDAEQALRIAIHKYQTRTVRALMYDCTDSLERYKNFCLYADCEFNDKLVKEYEESKKAWEEKANKYTEKRRKSEADSMERARQNRIEQIEQFKKEYPIPEGLSYSEKFKWLKALEINEGYNSIIERYYWSNHRCISDDVIKEILGHRCDAVWYEAEENKFKTSRSVTVDVTVDLIKLIKLVIQATPEQRQKFLNRHVGHFTIRGFVDDTVQVGCHTFLLEDLPSLIKQYENPDPEKISKQIQRLKDRIESCKSSIKTFEKEIEETEKEILTLSSKCDKNKE